MNINEVSVTKSFTRNLGNFESARVEFGLSATPEDGETVDEIKSKLEAKVDRWVVESVEEIDQDRKG